MYLQRVFLLLLLYYSLDQSLLWINHVGYCIRTKSPFMDWSTDNCNRHNKKSAPAVIIETQKYNKGGFTHPE